MKKIPKKLLDELIESSRSYWRATFVDEESCQKAQEIAYKIENQCGLNWLAIKDFVDSILTDNGIVPDAENDEIYSALRVLGWEAIDND